MNMLRDITKILKALETGDALYSFHALQQMNRRALTEIDVMSIASTCIRTQWQEDRKTYFIIGFASDGKGAAVSCKIDQGVVVVTVMRRHLSKKERDSRR
jgi:hypothetical protein